LLYLLGLRQGQTAGEPGGQSGGGRRQGRSRADEERQAGSGKPGACL
jgi:hypothetical protein